MGHEILHIMNHFISREGVLDVHFEQILDTNLETIKV